MPHKRAKRSVRTQQRSESDIAPHGKDQLSNEAIPKGAARILNAAKIQKEHSERKRKWEEGGEDTGNSEPSRRKRRKGGDGEESARERIKIQPGESITHFNRRVEDSMRSDIRAAVQKSSALTRKTRLKEEQEQLLKSKKTKTSAKKSAATASALSKSDKTAVQKSTSDTDVTGEKPKDTKPRPSGDRVKPQDFETIASSAPRRLNDIVQAPPELKKLPRGAAKIKAAKLANTAHAEDGQSRTLRQGALSMAQKAMLEEERERAVRMYRELKKGKTD